jgi:hypothetical protein
MQILHPDNPSDEIVPRESRSSGGDFLERGALPKYADDCGRRNSPG